MPAGTYDFEVTLADSGEIALTVPGMVLEGDTTYDLVLMGQPGDEDHPLELRPLSDTTRERRHRLRNAPGRRALTGRPSGGNGSMALTADQ